MYKLLTLKDSVRIPPELFGSKIEDAALQILRQKFERTVSNDLGIIISVHNAQILSAGKIVQGDGAAYFDVQFDALSFNCEVNEVVEGWVSQVVEFGAFVRLGPIDGLVHVSQVTTDFMSFDAKLQKLVTKNGKASLGKDESIKAKISTVSLKESIPSSKIALTMRSEGLGKEKKAAGEEKKKEKKKKE